MEKSLLRAMTIPLGLTNYAFYFVAGVVVVAILAASGILLRKRQ